MSRYDRTHFFAFGVLPILNCAAILIYGLLLATSTGGGTEQSVPALLVLALACGLAAMVAAIKRGRDLGWSAWITLAVFWVSVAMGPVLLALVAYLLFAKATPTAEVFSPPSSPATAVTWYWAVMNLIWPWILLAFLSKLL
jgi:uncharacterized membrane protein YhaH (DUF805 family)